VLNGEESAQPNRLDDLLADLPRGQAADYVGVPSNAHFESPQNILATESLRFDARQNLESKIFLGTVGGTVVVGPRLPDGRPTRWIEGGAAIGVGDDRHHLLIAGSRAGKGRSAILPVLLSLPPATSVLCIDPKGDLARYSIWWRGEILNQQCGVLDPFDCSGDATRKYRCIYNPIFGLCHGNRQTFMADARLIADSLIVPDAVNDKHWDDTAKQICSGLCAHVATHVKYAGRRDLVTVWKLASELLTRDPDKPKTYRLAKEMLGSDAAGGAVRASARQFYERSSTERSGVLSNLRKHLDWISYECMQEVLVGPSIDLRDLKRSSVCWYVTVPALRMDALRGWMRLIVQMSLGACEQEKSGTGNQCVMILDEFHALGRMSTLEVAIAQIAGLGAKLYIVLQNLSQLRHYGHNYETFIANAGLVQVMGCADDSTLDYVSRRLGQSLVLTRSTNSPTFEQAAKHAATGESWSLANHPLMTAEEIGRFFARDDKKLRQLILRPGFRPMILQRAFYDKHELFRGRCDG
jgi:type IV secretion system protein VirD4